MKIEFPENIYKKPIVSEQNNHSEKTADTFFKSDMQKIPDSSSVPKSEWLRAGSIMRLDAGRQIAPLKASDVLTAGEMEMLEKIFSDMRLAEGSREYVKK